MAAQIEDADILATALWGLALSRNEEYFSLTARALYHLGFQSRGTRKIDSKTLDNTT
jgi:hypothetical protein